MSLYANFATKFMLVTLRDLTAFCFQRQVTAHIELFENGNSPPRFHRNSSSMNDLFPH